MIETEAVQPSQGDENPFQSIAALLMDKTHTPGDLATAVETNGFFSWDRYGRYKDFEGGSEEGKNILDMLAAIHQHQTRCDDPAYKETPSPLDDYENFLFCSGWRQSDIPKSGIPHNEKNGTIKLVGALHPRTENSLLKIIGGLCHGQKLDLTRSSKTADIIENLVDQTGQKVGQDTIAKVLKQVLELTGPAGKS